MLDIGRVLEGLHFGKAGVTGAGKLGGIAIDIPGEGVDAADGRRHPFVAFLDLLALEVRHPVGVRHVNDIRRATAS